MLSAMRRLFFAGVLGVAAACGGEAANTPPSTPPPAPAAAATAEPPSTPSQPEAEKPEPAAAVTAEPPPPAPSAAPKVEFPPHASVDQAMNAVPRGLPRMNMSTDVMQGPLLDLKRYDKCKVPHSTKVVMSVAIFDGAAVGVDVTTKPKNAKMEACLDGVVRTMSWDKVPSLNQVTVTF
jgi:hypothetical protein